MTGADASAAPDDLERSLGEFLEGMDAFVASWSAALRRFAEEPAALRHFRDRPVDELRRTGPRFDAPPIPPRDPMWDRDLDG